MPVIRLLAVVCLTTWALAIPARADFPDHEYSDKVSIQLRERGYDPFPIYSRTANTGYVIAANGKVSWSGDARVYLPRTYFKKSYDRTPDGKFKKIPINGWQSNLTIEDPHAGMTFINVGNTTVMAGDQTLRKGDYVTYNGKSFQEGTLRAPDRVKEPEEINREKAAEMLTEARFRIALKQTEEAKAVLTELMQTYPSTKAAADANLALQKLDATASKAPVVTPPTLGRFADEDGRSETQIANDLLSLARARAELKQYEEAKAVCLTLIDRYPHTKAAIEAARLADSLQKEQRAAR